MLQITAVIAAVLQVSIAGMIHSRTEISPNLLNPETVPVQENNAMKNLIKKVFYNNLLKPGPVVTHKKRFLIISNGLSLPEKLALTVLRVLECRDSLHMNEFIPDKIRYVTQRFLML